MRARDPTSSATMLRLYTLQPLVDAGVLRPGPGVLSCTVGGTEYRAGDGSMPGQMPVGSMPGQMPVGVLGCPGP